MFTVRSPSFAFAAFAVLLTVAPLAGCSKGGTRKRSELSRWVDEPTKGTTKDNTITIPDLDVVFEIPDTLYVFRNCAESSHRPEGEQKWVPILSCSSTNAGVFGGAEESNDDPFGSDERAEESGAEQIGLTFYVTHKTRPLDERAVAWYENQLKQAGLFVEELSYQSEYHKKEGIYAKLRVLDKASGTPTREIVRFLFPRQDVVFIAQTEYPFGDPRAIEQDWSYILWNFDFGIEKYAADVAAQPELDQGEKKEPPVD